MKRLLCYLALLAVPSSAQILGPILHGANAAPVVNNITFVQAQNCSANSTTSCSTSSFAVSLHNALIVGCVDPNNPAQTFSASDGTNTFTQIGSNSSFASAGAMAMFYAKDITGGTRAVTCTVGTSGFPRMVVFEVSGLSTTAPFDKGPAFQNCGATTSCASTSITTTAANEILIAFLGNASGSTTKTAPSGYTLPTNGSIPANNAQSAMAYKIVTSTQTGNATWTLSSDASGAMLSSFQH